MKKALFSLIFAGFALFGCITDNTPKGPAGPTGVARIKLPELPGSSGKTTLAGEYNLSITVSGPGMQPLVREWRLSEYGGKTVTFEGIPAGSGRIFKGSLRRGMLVTHEGSYAADIGGGESVFVPLVLRDVGTGRAEICVEVEGWSSPDCSPIDTLPSDTIPLFGCWHIEAYEGITLISGTLSFWGMEGVTYGQFTFDGGITQFANAAFVNGAWRITLSPMIYDDLPYRQATNEKTLPAMEMPIDPSHPGLYRTYQLRIDSFTFGPADEPNGLFHGVMMDADFKNVVGKVTGSATRCANIIEPYDTTICVFPRPEPMIE